MDDIAMLKRLLMELGVFIPEDGAEVECQTVELEDEEEEGDYRSENGVEIYLPATKGRFDFKEFLQEPDKELSETMVQYEKYTGIDLTKVDWIESLPFYRDYLAHFDTDDLQIKGPGFFEYEFDYDLLFRLIAGSFSSGWNFEYHDGSLPRLAIRVSANNKEVNKYLDDLWGFQIARMYEIYIKEQLNLEVVMYENVRERDIVVDQRRRVLEMYDERMAKYRRKKLMSILQEGGRNETRSHRS